jgi:hypothetical protein
LNWPAMSKNRIYGLDYMILVVTHLVPYKQIISDELDLPIHFSWKTVHHGVNYKLIYSAS